MPHPLTSSSDISDQELDTNGYNLIRKDRNRHGGGVALYIKPNLSYEIIFVGTTIECIFVTVKINSCKVNVCVFIALPVAMFTTLMTCLTPYTHFL